MTSSPPIWAQRMFDVLAAVIRKKRKGKKVVAQGRKKLSHKGRRATK